MQQEVSRNNDSTTLMLPQTDTTVILICQISNPKQHQMIFIMKHKSET